MDPQFDLRKKNFPNEALREGFPPRDLGAGEKHPVEKVQLDRLRNEEDFKLKMLSAVYGTHAPIRHKMECGMLAQCGRLPGLPSSLVGLQTRLGLDEKIDFEDVLGVEKPEDPTRGRTYHEVLEKHFGV
uniref:Proteasome maturation factor UMP1 n=1 Tax=Chromera velia CCMP2878 TaxID=1169474 RepID=A0A0G4I9P7_9ALVE|mmetsp:Transcript_36165/g.71152  ORF Transcript_36165/g.71152 Transcript_36165/m.71152 type:complete len:129 (+) Transcript_36165:214-600(+)|eukprot:Cvel_12218.t1-p1 / transcript=Cvel_12218.t1 / gene=Cvel_12218 / organism=Chromera_velia_CCMP2878 / gene_product=Proteasome maturation protein homolog, putative / transcript_product=Proteasome maturation protein homolog, putative / location=Cvel_scaffold790:63204-64726(-) / protein_length=128 / sequence_SO=supercontig / SO=protein_coding / is_pseudo=false